MADQQIFGNRYRLSNRLGEGGMAEVHFGLDVRLCRPVAVKRLRLDLAADPAARAAFEREVRIGSRLSHANIVAVYDAGTTDNPDTGVAVPYIVLEYVPGKSLQSHLQMRDGQAMPPQQALELIDALLNALAHCHAAGVIHQDVKPGNVMVTPEGRVKLMDFGIARELDEGTTSPPSLSEIRGSVRYLAPERLRGGTSDARTDLYSVGCLLYRLLVGHAPFNGGSVSDIVQRQLTDTPSPPSQAHPGLGPSFDAVVLRALAKNPEDRFASAGAMAAALQAVGAAAADRGTPMLPVPVRRVHGEEFRPAPVAAKPPAGGAKADPRRLPATAPGRRPRRQRLVAAGVAAVLLPVAGMAVQSFTLGDAQESDVQTAAALGRPIEPGSPAGAAERSVRDAAAPGSSRSILPQSAAPSSTARAVRVPYASPSGVVPQQGGEGTSRFRPSSGANPTADRLGQVGPTTEPQPDRGDARPVRPSPPSEPSLTKDPSPIRPRPPAREVRPPNPPPSAERPVSPPPAPPTTPDRGTDSKRPPKAPQPTKPPKAPQPTKPPSPPKQPGRETAKPAKPDKPPKPARVTKSAKPDKPPKPAKVTKPSDPAGATPSDAEGAQE